MNSSKQRPVYVQYVFHIDRVGQVVVRLHDRRCDTPMSVVLPDGALHNVARHHYEQMRTERDAIGFVWTCGQTVRVTRVPTVRAWLVTELQDAGTPRFTELELQSVVKAATHRADTDEQPPLICGLFPRMPLFCGYSN